MRTVFPLLFILGITIIMTFALPNRSIRDLGFMKHVQATEKFWCGTPQLRSIPIKELLPHASPEEGFFPTATVLARCDEFSGCCGKDHVCAPLDKHVVDLVFIVNHLVDKNRPKHYEVIRADNHTRCHCVADAI